MPFNLFKRSSLITVPSLYLFYLIKKEKLNAKEPEANGKQLLTNYHQNDFKNQTINLNYKRKRSYVDNLKRSKQESVSLVEAFRTINNVPGVVVGVSFQGKEIWSFGNGLADLETRALCTDDSIMRIASISKSITMLLLGKLLEEGKLDLDKPINQYLNADKFPQKYFDNQKVDITLRQLVSHLGGIRHYLYDKKDAGEFESKEYYLNEFFDNVYEAIKLFKGDELQSKPGTSFLYSTNGFTLISAVIQSVLGDEKKFETELIKLLKEELEMHSTLLDSNETIIPNRTKYYAKNQEKTKLINVKEVDNSYKWAGGGLLSDVHDLLKFGNAMLFSYKTSNGILKQETMKLFWTPNELTSKGLIKDVPFKYAMGFEVYDKRLKNKYKGLEKTSLNKVVFHTGAAVGVTSILLILPREEICVAIMVNLKSCPGIGTLSMNIAKSIYRNVEDIYELN